MYDLGIIIPVYNEGENVFYIYEQIKEYASLYKIRTQIIFVNDHSTDETELYLSYLETKVKDSNDLSVKVLINNKKGQQSAICYGLKNNTAKYVSAIDCDMQDPVKVLFRMYLTLIKEKKKAIIGVKKTRQDTLFKKATASLYYITLSLILKKHIRNASDFFIIHKKEISLIDEANIRGSIQTRLTPIIYKYHRHGRQYGRGKYSLFKMLKLSFIGIKWAFFEKSNKKIFHN